MKNPILLLILDGWGIRKEKKYNSIKLAKTPNYDRILKEYPFTELNASGIDVGLPKMQMGNSEVGHLTIGSGRIISQDLLKINNSIKNKSFFKNKILKTSIKKAIDNNKNIHLAGLLSDGGVHSHINHLKALIKMAKNLKAKNIFIHAILDGRDVFQKSAINYIVEIENYFKKIKIGQILTISGRFYLMDRDNNYDRLKKGYDAIVLGKGLKAKNAIDAIKNAYKKNETDEFITPTIIINEKKFKKLKNEDLFIFFNFRSDRAREISRVFLDKNFQEFKRKNIKINYICFTQYDKNLKCDIVFPLKKIKNTLGEIISKKGYKQIRIAETEKYAHVTFFFNGGIESPNKGEERILIPSSNVRTYDLKPKMSLDKLTSTVINILKKDKYDLIIVNFANGDMVGHTGVLKASIKSVEHIDKKLKLLEKKILKKNGIFLITADHGNCEKMFDTITKKILTSHTLNKVPFILISNKKKEYKLKKNTKISLKDIAPTILTLFGEKIPKEMTGSSLILKNKN